MIKRRANLRVGLNFYKDINTDLLQNGFYLDKRISTKQFDIQREIIKDFLEKKIKIDHIESLLVNPSKVKSPILKRKIMEKVAMTGEEVEDEQIEQISAYFASLPAEKAVAKTK